MGWNLRLKLDRLVTGRQPPPIRVRKLTDKEEILSYLERERSYAAAAIAHLEPNLAVLSKWFLTKSHEDFALCLISKSLSPSYMLALGDEHTLDYLLASIPLPGEVFVTFQPRHLSTIESFYDLDQCFRMMRMIVKKEDFIPMAQEATRLHSSHIDELNRLYRQYGETTFAARQIRRGVYYGIWRDGHIVAVAGTHLISPTYGIAYVGNVLTHPEYRNQGLATICTSAVTADLLDHCREVVLNVEPQNLPAIRAYGNLGYRNDCLMIEALGRRKSLAGEIISKLWRKIGFSQNYAERMEADG